MSTNPAPFIPTHFVRFDLEGALEGITLTIPVRSDDDGDESADLTALAAAAAAQQILLGASASVVDIDREKRFDFTSTDMQDWWA